jgi:hypothetical protein
VEIVEQVDRRLLVVDHLVERLDRVGKSLRSRRRRRCGLAHAAGDRPDAELLVAPLGDALQVLLDARLFPAHDVDHRIARADEELELVAFVRADGRVDGVDGMDGMDGWSAARCGGRDRGGARGGWDG